MLFKKVLARGLRNAVTPAFAFLFIVAWSPDPVAAEGSGVSRQATVKKFDLQWPGDTDREALVYLQLVISKEGRAIEVSLGDGGFHQPRFVTAAIRAARKARFNPALLEGVPVQTTGRMPIKFNIVDGQPGLTDEFAVEMDKVDALIRKGDYAGAHFHAQWMLAEKATLNYEFMALSAQLAQTHASVGNTHRALAAARTATTRTSTRIEEFQLDGPIPENSPAEYMLPYGVVARLLELRMKLAISKGLYFEALQSYRDLAGLAPVANDAAAQKTAAGLIATLKNNQPLVGQLQIEESGTWLHSLFHHRFAAGNVRGELTQTDIRCGADHRTVLFAADAQIDIPADAQQCVAVFHGSPGTEFDVTEYPPEQGSAVQ